MGMAASLWFGDFIFKFSTGIFIYLLCLSSVKADFCEWFVCENDQYCCGNNKCCNYVYSTWYFWTGIIVVVFMLLSVCLLRLHQCNHHYIYSVFPVGLPTKENDKTPIITSDKPI